MREVDISQSEFLCGSTSGRAPSTLTMVLTPIRLSSINPSSPSGTPPEITLACTWNALGRPAWSNRLSFQVSLALTCVAASKQQKENRTRITIASSEGRHRKNYLRLRASIILNSDSAIRDGQFGTDPFLGGTLSRRSGPPTIRDRPHSRVGRTHFKGFDGFRSAGSAKYATL